MKIFAHLFSLLDNALSHVITVLIHSCYYISRKPIPWTTHKNYTKGTIQPFAFLKCPWRVKKITCAIKGRENCTRGFNVEDDEGIFGIFWNHVFQAPRERVHALLTFIDGHEDLPFLCCHVSHLALWSDGWKLLMIKLKKKNALFLSFFLSFCVNENLVTVMNVWEFLSIYRQRRKIMCWVKSVGGFVGFGLKGFVICGFQTQWAPW